MKVLTTKQTVEEAQKIAEQHVETHKFNQGNFAEFRTCQTCGGEMPVKFKKNGKPCDWTKLYHLVNTGNGNLEYAHNNLRICYERTMKKKWGLGQ